MSVFGPMRLNLSNLGVMTLAIACSLTAAFWVNQLGDRGQAQAAVVPVTVAAAPVSTPATGPDTRIARSDDGHYWAEARMNVRTGGRPIRVMVDTGASVVALTRADAERLGVHVTAADFSGTIITAAGRVRAAPVTLASVSIGGTRVNDVEALVIENGLPHSLLGMSYLGRLSSFTATPTTLTLKS